MINDQQSFTISKKSFLTSTFIIAGLIIVAYLLTLLIPQGRFADTDKTAREEVIPRTYSVLETQNGYLVLKKSSQHL